MQAKRALALISFFVAILFFSGAGNVLFIPLALILIAVVFSSHSKGIEFGFKYMRLFPIDKGALFFVAWGAATLAFSFAVTWCVSGILLLLGLLDTAPVAQKILSLPFPALITAVTLAPLAEEMLFRGYFFRKITEASMGKKERKAGVMPLVSGAIVSSALFAAMHFSYGSLAEVMVAFFIGLVLCVSARKSGSLVPAVLAHASFNLLSIAFTVLL